MLGSAIAGPSVTPILLRAERDPRWPASVAALTRLAGWLDEHGTQIDYQRRRHLDYRSLLPDADWIQACRSTGTVPGEQSRSLTARRWLFERISGTPADLAPGAYAVTTAGQRSRLDKFAVFVTPGLVASLDSYAGTWLAGNRIDSEEVTWRPPASLLSGLDLPGPDPFALQPGEIHELIRPRRMSPRAAARHAGTTIDAIRAVLDEHPAPPQPLTPGQQRTAGRVIAALRARITPADLRDLYITQKVAPRELGRRLGAGRRTIIALLDEYGIPRRSAAEARPPFPVDRDWLYEQYVTRNRTLTDIATELGTSNSNITHRLRALGIPFRGHAGRHRAASPPA